MAISGNKGKVYYVDDGCPTVNCETGAWSAPSGGDVCLPDEVTRFGIADRVNLTKYGHDKSGGMEDNCAGTRGLDISLDANCLNQAYAGGGTPLYAGKVLYLKMYPTGTTCGRLVAGYATVQQISFEYDIDTGKPISYTATLASKGPWTGIGGTAWGGHECDCPIG